MVPSGTASDVGFERRCGALVTARRKEPPDDLATVIAQGQLDGAPIPPYEAISYFVLIVTAGHDTASSSIVGGLLALLENPAQLARLQRDRALLSVTPGASR
jgi:cytochrome P450